LWLSFSQGISGYHFTKITQMVVHRVLDFSIDSKLRVLQWDIQDNAVQFLNFIKAKIDSS
jgi:hypothetical protein